MYSGSVNDCNERTHKTTPTNVNSAARNMPGSIRTSKAALVTPTRTPDVTQETG